MFILNQCSFEQSLKKESFSSGNHYTSFYITPIVCYLNQGVYQENVV